MADLYCLGCGEPWELSHVLHDFPRELVCDHGLWPDVAAMLNDAERYKDAVTQRWRKAGDGRLSALLDPEVQAAVERSEWRFHAGHMGMITRCPGCRGEIPPLSDATIGMLNALLTHSPEDLTTMRATILDVVARDPMRIGRGRWKAHLRGGRKVQIHGIKFGGPEFFGVPTAAGNPVYVVEDRLDVPEVIKAIREYHGVKVGAASHDSSYNETYRVHLVYARAGMDTTNERGKFGGDGAMKSASIGCEWHTTPADWLRCREVS